MSIVTTLRNDYSDWIKSLTDDEIKALKKYTYNSIDNKPNRFFERMNAMLRGDSPEDELLLKYANIISKALKRSYTKREIICYRGMSTNPVDGYDIGDIFTLDQFVSTSIIQTKALPGDINMIIHIPIGKHAAYIEQVSCFPKQRELLLDKDCIYKLISNKDDLVEMEVI